MKMKRIMALVMTSAMVMGTLPDVAQAQTRQIPRSHRVKITARLQRQLRKPLPKKKSGTEPRMARQLLYSSGEVFSRNTDMMKLLKISIRNMRIRVYRWNITVMLTTQTETFSWRLI